LDSNKRLPEGSLFLWVARIPIRVFFLGESETAAPEKKFRPLRGKKNSQIAK